MTPAEPNSDRQHLTDHTLEWKSVESSNVARVLYAPAARVIYVHFKDGSVYSYGDRSAEQYAALLAASSIGSYLHRAFGKGRRLAGAEVAAL